MAITSSDRRIRGATAVVEVLTAKPRLLRVQVVWKRFSIGVNFHTGSLAKNRLNTKKTGGWHARYFPVLPVTYQFIELMK